MTPAVYVQTNDAADNEVLAFEPLGDGRPPRLGASHGRSRNRKAAPAVPELDRAQRRRPAAAGRQRGQRRVVAVRGRGGGLRLADRVASGGATPTSVAVSGDLVYVLNNGTPNIAGFRIARRPAASSWRARRGR